MNKLKLIALSLLLGLVTVSCTDVLDNNVNPDKAHAITAEVGLPTLHSTHNRPYMTTLSTTIICRSASQRVVKAL